MSRIRILILAAALGACGETTVPLRETAPPTATAPPTFRLASKTASDTIGALLPSAIQVSVNDGRGQPMTAAAVTLRVIPHKVFVDPGVVLRASGSDTLATLRTSATGTATVDVALAGTAGAFDVAVSVDGIARVDTMHFTVLPGAATSMRVRTRDTTVTVAVPYRPKIEVVDRLGNVRSDAMQLSSSVATCQTSGDAVTASDVARCKIFARVGALRDSLTIIAVPAGRVTMVIYQFGGLWIGTMNLDGSNVKIVRPITISSFDPAHPVIASTGIMASMAIGADNKTHIQIIEPNGDARFIPVNLPLGAEQTWPIFAPDGQSVFFSACNWPIFEHCRVWQTRLDGSAPKILTPAATSTGQRSNMADITPDGTMLVYAGRGARLRTLDLQTGRDVDLGFNVDALAIDPTGTRIASIRYAGGLLDPIVITNRDGSNPQTVGSGLGFADELQWLPGGQWLLSYQIVQDAPDGAHGVGRVLVNVSTGEVIKFGYQLPVSEVYIRR